MTIQTSRRLQFCAGHRVYGHENVCGNLHGHNWIVWLYIEGPQLDSVGRVLDFKEIKNRFDSWIQENWDHAFIWYAEDHLCKIIFDNKSGTGQAEELRKLKNFKLNVNPTAENLAKCLLESVGPKLLFDTECKLTKVELYETENCKVEVSL